MRQRRQLGKEGSGWIDLRLRQVRRGIGLEEVVSFGSASPIILGIVILHISPEGLMIEALSQDEIGLRFAISRESSGKLERLTSVLRDSHAG